MGIKVSIVTITWNAARTLQRTLDSVRCQSYSDIEHLVIDGASKDDTLQIAERYQAASPHEVVVQSEPDKGLYDAMNKGLLKATGDYVVFLNAGDSLYAPDTIETVVQSAENNSLTSHLSPLTSHTLPAVIYGDTAITDEDGHFLHLRQHRPPETLTWRSFKQGMLVCHQAFYVRRDVAKDILYDLRYRHSADVDWCIRVMKEAERQGLPLVNTHTVLANFEEGGNTTQNHRASLKERFRVMSNHYGFLVTLLLHVWFVLRAVLTKFGYSEERRDLLAAIREGRQMTQREKLWLIVSLSIPSILAQISATVMFFIDASMVGHLGARATAAIGLVETTGWLMGGLGMAASMGFSVQVAHAIGANDMKRARRVLRQSLVCCTLWSMAITLAALSVSTRLPYWLGGTEEIAREATIYFIIIGVFGICYQLNGLAASMLKCSGNMKIPSVLNICMCVMDVVFNYLLIYVFELGVLGAALGTGLAELITAALMLYFLLWRSEMLGLFTKDKSRRPTSWRDFKPRMEIVRNAFQIGGPMGLNHVLMGSAQIVSTVIVAPLGTVAIAAHSLAITVESLCYMPGFGIAEAATTLVGQSYGAAKRQLCQSFARMSAGLGIAVMSLMGVLMWLFAPELMAIMTPVREIIAMGAECLRIEAFAEPMFAAAIVCNGIFVGTGDTLRPALMNLLSMWGVRLTLAALMATAYGLPGVWTAMAIELTFRGLIFLARLFHGGWMKNNLNI